MTYSHAGGASGFGAATSKLFASQGAKVLIADINVAGAEAIASTDANMVPLLVNVVERKDWDKAVEEVLKRFGRLDIVVNNAGTTYRNKVSLLLLYLQVCHVGNSGAPKDSEHYSDATANLYWQG